MATVLLKEFKQPPKIADIIRHIAFEVKVDHNTLRCKVFIIHPDLLATVMIARETQLSRMCYTYDTSKLLMTLELHNDVDDCSMGLCKNIEHFKFTAAFLSSQVYCHKGADLHCIVLHCLTLHCNIQHFRTCRIGSKFTCFSRLQSDTFIGWSLEPYVLGIWDWAGNLCSRTLHKLIWSHTNPV